MGDKNIGNNPTVQGMQVYSQKIRLCGSHIVILGIARNHVKTMGTKTFLFDIFSNYPSTDDSLTSSLLKKEEKGESWLLTASLLKKEGWRLECVGSWKISCY